MIEALRSYLTLRWTQQPMFHPLPSHITHQFLKTSAGDIELLVSEPASNSGPEQPPIFFVHGGNGHASVWLEWMTHLSNTYNARTYAYSLRNHGASFSVPYLKMVWGTSFDDLASDLIAAINEAQRREGQELVFVAHSSGGGLSQYVLANGQVRARALALVGAVPHFGNMEVYINWFSRIDPWFTFRNMCHFFHPNSGLNTMTLVYNAFFGPDYPIDRVPEFQRWMSNYECMWWPFSMAGHGWGIKGRTWLQPTDILKNIVSWKAAQDKVMVMIGTADLMMGGTEDRMAKELRVGITELEAQKKLDISIGVHEKAVIEAMDKCVTEERQGGVRLVRVKNAGHHTQNDVQWREAAEALRRFAEQA